MADSSPKTPEKVERIPRDDSFKTCKTTMATPRTRRQLRMTPARASILSGGKPFKEGVSSGKKFNTRRRRQLDETARSNETFTRCEQELMFDRDSLEASKLSITSFPKLSISSTPKPPPQVLEKESPPKLREKPELQEKPKPNPPKETKSQEVTKPQEEIKLAEVKNQSLSKQPTFLKNKKAKNTLMPPPAAPKVASDPGNRFITPRVSKPASLIGTSSRYLSQWNNSYITRARSYKSTAELERDYFSSLRSF